MKKLLLVLLIFVFFDSDAVVTRGGSSTNSSDSRYLSLHTYLKLLKKKGRNFSPKTDRELTELLNSFSPCDKAVLAAVMLHKHSQSNVLHTCWRCKFLEKFLEETSKKVKDEVLLFVVKKTVKTKWAKVCEILIEFDADPNRKDVDGCPLLYLAIKKNRPEVVGMLIECGGVLNIYDEFYGTPLTYALCKLCDNDDYLAVVNVVLNHINHLPSDEKNKLVNEKTDALYSPIFYAIKSQEPYLVQRLIDYGAKVSISCLGKSPYDYACKFDNDEIKKIIWQALHDENYCI
ncbi:MAG: hypothetical protein ABIA74_05430 [bacterium]